VFSLQRTSSHWHNVMSHNKSKLPNTFGSKSRPSCHPFSYFVARGHFRYVLITALRAPPTLKPVEGLLFWSWVLDKRENSQSHRWGEVPSSSIKRGPEPSYSWVVWWYISRPKHLTLQIVGLRGSCLAIFLGRMGFRADRNTWTLSIHKSLQRATSPPECSSAVGRPRQRRKCQYACSLLED
jgi:hypothetical protein